MNAPATIVDAIATPVITKRSPSSRTTRRVVATTALLCAAGVLTAVDAPFTTSAPPSIPVSAWFAAPPAVQGSSPAAEATEVPGRAPLMVRFTAPMSAASLTPESVTLVGPTGTERTRVMTFGALAVIQPVQELLPASRYTLFIKGAADIAQRPLPLSSIGFDTAAKLVEAAPADAPRTERSGRAVVGGASPVDLVDASRGELGAVEQLALARAELTHDPEDWIPDAHNFTGRWRADRDASPLQSLPSLQAPAGNTALTGQVLGMDGRAVQGVTLRVAGREARTDRTGRFLLAGLEAGFAKMEIDGVTANGPDLHYGYYAARIELAPGRTTVVPYTIWMPRLDPAGTIQIAAPTTTETIVTSPRIPGLELHIPAGTVIRDRQGRIVTELNLTAIPVDRPPFPVPDLGVPVYFTVQPGGAVFQSVTGKPSPGARLFYPNFKKEQPGARGTFWNYDPDGREWFVYGLGTISGDAKQAIPDPGVVIHELTGAMFNGGHTPSPVGPLVCSSPKDEDACGDAGDPVNTLTGQFDHVEHDAFLRDVISIDVTRTYSNLDLNQRTFGVGMSLGYDVFLYSQNQWQEVDLILPSGSRVHYARTSPGTDFQHAIFQSSAPGKWNHSVIARNQARGGWDLLFRNGAKWFFPQFQPLHEITDPNGNTLRIVRQDNDGTAGNIARIISPNGRSLELVYNASGFVQQTIDNVGRTYTYNYDATGHLIEEIDPMGGHRTYAWQAFATGPSSPPIFRLAEIHDPRGNLVVRNDYDGAGAVIHQELDDGATYDYAYTTIPCHPPIPNQGAQLCYPFPVSVDVTSRRGTVRRVTYDLLGRVTANTYGVGLPEQQVVGYEYTNDNLLKARIDPLNRRTEYTYDDHGNITSVTRMAGTAEAATWTTTWDTAIAKPLTLTEPTGNATVMTYDSKGNLLSLQNEPGLTWTFTYDAQGRLLTKTNPLGNVTALAYVGADLASVTDPLQRKLQVSTDAVGRQTATVDPLGNRTTFHWDDLNRLLDITNPLGGVTSFEYDANGNITSRIDAKGHATTYTHNALNEPVLTTDALQKQTSYSFEPGGKVAREVDRNGKLKALTYDALGRLKTVGFGASVVHPTAFTSMIENTWDAAGRISEIREKSCTDPVGHPGCSSVATLTTTTREFDSFDHVIREVTPQGEIDYAYDSVGRRLSMTIKNGPPGAQILQPTITYSYDHSDQLTGITQAAGPINGGQPQTVTLAHDGAGRRIQTTLPNGATVSYTHDDAGQVTTITYKQADGTLLGDLSYGYDANGRKISVGGSLARTSLPGADVTDAAYDANNRLLTWAGNTYSYDDEGELIGDGVNQYQWNDQKRLSAISSGASTVASFAYDARGRRRAKTIAATTTGFLYDHDNVVQELDGTAIAAPVKTHFMTGGLDQLFLRLEGNSGSTRRSLLSDPNNNTLSVLDDSQAPVCTYQYDPYGATTETGASGNTQQYGGRENDNPGNAQGLYFNRARYYMPALGRFISQDPIGWASGQTNNYAYAGGDPINFNDPTGFDGAAAGTSGGRRGPRERGDRMRGDSSLEDRLEQERGVREARDRLRRTEVEEDEYLNPDERIRSTGKSEQNTDNALKDIKSLADAEEAARDPFSEDTEGQLTSDEAGSDDDTLRTVLVDGAAGTIGAVGGAVAADATAGTVASLLAAMEGFEMADLLLVLIIL